MLILLSVIIQLSFHYFFLQFVQLYVLFSCD